MSNEAFKTIDELGIDQVAILMADAISQKMQSEDVAIQFILEELEAASQGNDIAKQFALNSGFDKADYTGAMMNSFEAVDGPDGPQQLLLNFCMMLMSDQNLMTSLRVKTVDNVLKTWKLGKYAAVNESVRLINVVKKLSNQEQGVFANINNDLNESISQDNDVMILMAYGYARRAAAAGLFLQGVFSKDNYMQASKIFKSLQVNTGQSVDFQEAAAAQADELLQSYNSRLTKNIVVKITRAVELNEVVSAYEHNVYYSFEKVLDYFE